MVHLDPIDPENLTLADTLPQARALLRRTSILQDESAATVVRQALSRFPNDLVVLRSALDIFAKNGLTKDAAGVADALLAMEPADIALVGRCLYALRADGRTEQAAAAAAAAHERSRTAALRRPGICDAIARQPHLAAYYDGGDQQQWLPYVMSASPPLVQKDVLNTDSRGFRRTVLTDGRALSPAEDPQALGNAVVFGGSTVFGVGASNDAHTLPSLLSTPDWRYYNLGTRAHVLPQNTITMLFEMPHLRAVRRIVLLAGWNDLIAIQRANVVPRGFGTFFGWSGFCRSHNPVVAHFPVEDWPRSVRARYSTSADRDGDLAHAEMLQVTDVMLGAWRMFADHLGAELHYVLQPARDWIDRNPPQEEDELNRILAGAGADAVSEVAAWARSWYPDALRTICERHRIPFHDGNRLLERDGRRDAWLFVDAAHLTDLGHRVLADVLAPEFDHAS